eukprot:553565_1
MSRLRDKSDTVDIPSVNQLQRILKEIDNDNKHKIDDKRDVDGIHHEEDNRNNPDNERKNDDDLEDNTLNTFQKALKKKINFANKRENNWVLNKTHFCLELSQTYIKSSKVEYYKKLCVDHNNYLNIRPKMFNIQSTNIISQQSPVFLSEENMIHSFEKQIAKWLGYTSSMVFQSGFAANSGLIQILLSRQMYNELNVYVDNLCHASIIYGLKIFPIKILKFKHNNTKNLDFLINKHGSGLIILESIYSQDGSIAPIKDIVKISDKYNCDILCDESHSLGLYKSSSLTSHYGLQNKISFITASLAKSFITRAGIVIYNKNKFDLTSMMQYGAVPRVFSSAVEDYAAESLMNILNNEMKSNDMDFERNKLWKLTFKFRNLLKQNGFNINDDINQSGAIIAIGYGMKESDMLLLRDYCALHNVFAAPFVYPACRKGTGFLRITLNTSLDEKDIEWIKLIKNIQLKNIHAIWNNLYYKSYFFMMYAIWRCIVICFLFLFVLLL